jgi:hypothetical protein
VNNNNNHDNTLTGVLSTPTAACADTSAVTNTIVAHAITNPGHRETSVSSPIKTPTKQAGFAHTATPVSSAPHILGRLSSVRRRRSCPIQCTSLRAPEEEAQDVYEVAQDEPLSRRLTRNGLEHLQLAQTPVPSGRGGHAIRTKGIGGRTSGLTALAAAINRNNLKAAGKPAVEMQTCIQRKDVTRTNDLV